MRVGTGHDTHRLEPGRPLILGGVRIEHPRGLVGHSDADVVLHALTDALLGAAGLGDIGDPFPDTDPRWRGCRLGLVPHRNACETSGRELARCQRRRDHLRPGAEAAPVKAAIRANLARLLGVDVSAVNVKAKTGESVGHIGRGEAIGCHAVVLIVNEREVRDGIASLQHADPAEGSRFTRQPPGKVSMYVCGPTVYKPSHIGHMVGPVIFDTVKRYLTLPRLTRSPGSSTSPTSMTSSSVAPRS